MEHIFYIMTTTSLLTKIINLYRIPIIGIKFIRNRMLIPGKKTAYNPNLANFRSFFWYEFPISVTLFINSIVMYIYGYDILTASLLMAISIISVTLLYFPQNVRYSFNPNNAWCWGWLQVYESSKNDAFECVQHSRRMTFVLISSLPLLYVTPVTSYLNMIVTIVYGMSFWILSRQVKYWFTNINDITKEINVADFSKGTASIANKLII